MNLRKHDHLREERRPHDGFTAGLWLVLILGIMVGGVLLLLHCEHLSFR